MATRLHTTILAGLLVAAIQPAEALAAPQILALLKTGGPAPLACVDGNCGAEFSGFCLQRDRPDPSPGTRYRAEGGDLTLVVTDGAGTVTRVPVGDYVDIATQRSYTAVRISLPESAMQELGAVSVALEIGKRVALVPIAEPGAADPQTEADIALALGPQRVLGEKIIQRSAVESGASR